MPITQRNKIGMLEAMLFASGDPIGADKLAQAVQLPQLSVEPRWKPCGSATPGRTAACACST